MYFALFFKGSLIFRYIDRGLSSLGELQTILWVLFLTPLENMAS